jgi:hypothetical protein
VHGYNLGLPNWQNAHYSWFLSALVSLWCSKRLKRIARRIPAIEQIRGRKISSNNALINAILMNPIVSTNFSIEMLAGLLKMKTMII